MWCLMTVVMSWLSLVKLKNYIKSSFLSSSTKLFCLSFEEIKRRWTMKSIHNDMSRIRKEVSRVGMKAEVGGGV